MDLAVVVGRQHVENLVVVVVNVSLGDQSFTIVAQMSKAWIVRKEFGIETINPNASSWWLDYHPTRDDV